MDRNTKKRTQHYAITLWWSTNAYKIKFAQQKVYYVTNILNFSPMWRRLHLTDGS